MTIPMIALFALVTAASPNPDAGLTQSRTELKIIPLMPTGLSLTSGRDLARRELPDPNRCQGQHWVGRFCRYGVDGAPPTVAKDICWRYHATVYDGWEPTWQNAQREGNLNLLLFDQRLFLPGVLNPGRIPTHPGQQQRSSITCAHGSMCMTAIDEDNDPHVACVKSTGVYDWSARETRYLLSRTGRFKSVGVRMAEMEGSVGPDSTPVSPGGSPIGSPVRGRPLAAVYEIENDVKAASLSTALQTADGHPFKLEEPLFATLVAAADVGKPGKGLTAPGELLCTASDEQRSACFTRAVHDFHKGDNLVVHFDASLANWAAGPVDFTIYTAVAHFGKSKEA